ncbi:hypothetical protein [Telmatospirillum sp.]|uniref:hypothetical protein n=1 Tax=Telmatospirillum sp. TaxID=2079197 RepID=UPI002841EA11|nr:hypothetical protein [Telmatospirillum sp.]MDR3439122.1 hypothetical protein [Telmatospirillum sp.]
MKEFLPLALLLSIAGSMAFADERPARYDMDGYCARLSNTSDGFSPEVMQRCLVAQSDALDQVKRLWANTPDYIQRDCDLRTRARGDEDYTLLEKCIHDQLHQSPPDVALPPIR